MCNSWAFSPYFYCSARGAWWGSGTSGILNKLMLSCAVSSALAVPLQLSSLLLGLLMAVTIFPPFIKVGSKCYWCPREYSARPWWAFHQNYVHFCCLSEAYTWLLWIFEILCCNYWLIIGNFWGAPQEY